MRNTQAFVWQDGKMHGLPTLGGFHAAARAMNSVGHIAGGAQTSSGEMRAVRWERDRPKDLGTLSNGDFSETYAINDREEVVGAANVTVRDKAHAFVWSGNRMRDLGTLPGGSLRRPCTKEKNKHEEIKQERSSQP